MRTSSIPWITALTVCGASVCLAEETASAPLLEEVVITAQKRTERLQDVPVSAAVVSNDRLANANVSDISDLNNIVPSVNMNAALNGRVPLGIRGVQSNSNEATVGISSGVAIMIDGVPVPSDSFGGNNLEDVARVEVLKGPQSTLGGRTASSGVINIVTRGPSDHLTGSTSMTFTNDHEKRINAFLAGPISDRLEYSVFGYWSDTDFPITNIATGDKSFVQPWGVRAKLQFNATDDLTISLMGRYGFSEMRGANLVYSYVTPGAYLLFGTAPPPLPPPALAALSQAALLAGITPSNHNDAYNSPILNSGTDLRDRDGTLNIDYRFNGLVFTSTTALQRETQFNRQDLFAVATYWWNNFAAVLGIPGPGFPNYQTIDQTVRQFTQEFKLASPTDRDFSYLVGAFYSDSQVNSDQVRALPPQPVIFNVIPETRTYDLYARTTWKFLPTTSLITGLRYNHDRLSYKEDQTIQAPYGAFTSSGSDDSSAIVGDLSLQHQLTPNSSVYFTYSRGYAPKVYNTALPLSSSAPVEPVGQTKINHFELGSKGTYADGSVIVNVAAFDTLYRDFQIQSFSNLPGFLAPPLILESAGKAETRGLELDTTWAASKTTRVDLNMAYIDARFTDYPDAPCWVGQTIGCAANATTGQLVQNVSGKQMPNSPRFKASLAVEQRIPLDAAPFDLVFGGSYAYRSTAQMLPDQNPEAIQSGFGLLNLNFGAESNSGQYKLTVFVNNVTNHFYAGDVEDFWAAPWNSNNVIMQPARDAERYYGVRLYAGF